MPKDSRAPRHRRCRITTPIFSKRNAGFEDLENIQDYLLDNELYSDENYAISCDLYEKVKVEALVLYPGVIETLQKLKEQELDIALVTDAHS